MTATTSSRVSPGHYRFAQVARMEWAKVRTLRSTTWILLIVAAGMIGLAIVALRQYPSDWAHMSAAQRASFDPTRARSFVLVVAIPRRHCHPPHHDGWACDSFIRISA